VKQLAAGNWLWLLRHEMRLAWRNIGGKRLWVMLIGGGILWACVHFAAWGLLYFDRRFSSSEFGPAAIPLGGTVFWVFFSIMISQTTAHAVSALFDRGDLDLLLASPLSPRAIFTVRGLGIAIGACLLPLLLMLPFAHAGLVTGHPGLLAIYPVIISLGLVTAAIGMMLTMTLVRIFGARRAKTFTQILAALIGAAFFLLSQMQNFLPRHQQSAVALWIKQESLSGGWLARDSVLWWPVRAMLGELLPLAVVVVFGAGSFWLVVNITFKHFVSGTQETLSGGTTASPRRAMKGARNFRRGLIANLMVKEWKLIIRDPQIISQTLLQILYLIPLLFLGFKGERNAWLLVPGFVMITSMLAGNLAWLTIAAEDAPELVGTAPIAIEKVRWIKAVAAVLPVFALLLPLALYWFTRDAYAAFVLVFCSLGGMFSAALCQIWNPRQGSRHEMKKRYRENRLVNILEALGAMGWAGVAVCLNGHWLWLPLAVAAVLLGPGTAWVMGRGARMRGALA
jgi:ABC-2 type transport system permease protein